MYKENGLYIIKDEFFHLYAGKNWVQNKGESRPHYYAIEDKGLLWMVPMTSQVENIKVKIARQEARYGVGNCLFYSVGTIAGVERGFKIGDMFPVTDEYILRTYSINGIPYVVRNEELNSELQSKARRFLAMVRRGALRDQLGVLAVERKLRAGCSMPFRG